MLVPVLQVYLQIITMRGSDTSILLSKMKYSNFLDARLSNPRLVRESEPPVANMKSVSTKKKDRPSISPQISAVSKTAITSSTRLLSKPTANDTQAVTPRKYPAIQSIMKNLKTNYPRFSNLNELTRAKSVQVLQAPYNSKNQQCKNSMEEIEQKISRFSRKQQVKVAQSPQKQIIGKHKSPQRLDIATQKCRQLCLQLKKKLFKETVSTTTTEAFQEQLSIKQFVLGKLLGKGKFSKVYLAMHKKTGYLVAIKIITKQTIRKERFSDQLARQIKIQAYFNHVNLIRMYGFFADEKNVYLVLEYCPGGQLYDIFKVKSRLKEDEWAPIMKGICQGLFALHLHDVIHRDLKPENIILAMGLPKIGDFGWAVYSPGDRRDTFCGTPLYISPQLLMGGGYDKQVDIWALGVMMYQFLTGRIPFRLEENTSLLQIVNSKIEFPESLSQLSCSLLKMILNKDPLVRLGIMDILDHPYLKNCLAGSSSINNLLRSGR